VQYPLGFAGGAGGIEDEQRILGVHPLRFAFTGGVGHALVVPDVTPIVPGDVGTGVADHQGGMDVGAALQGLVHLFLQGNGATATAALVGGDHHAAVGVEDAILERFRGETSEHHGMDGPNAGTGKHGIGGLGNHRHVDTDPVSLGDAVVLQGVGQFAHLLVQLAIGDLLVGPGVVAFPDDGRLVPTALQVAIDAVVAYVELAPLEPTDECLVVVPLQHLVPRFVPVEKLFRLLRPESLRVVDGALVHGLVLLFGDMCAGRKGCGYLIDFGFGHRSPLLFSVAGIPTGGE